MEKKAGDCDDFATLAADLLRERGYTTRLVVVYMHKDVHVVCYVAEVNGYLDYNRRKNGAPLIKCGAGLADVAASVASSFKTDWRSVSEFSFHSTHKFLRQHLVGGRPRAVFVVMNDRFAEARSLRQACRAGNDRLENFFPKVLPHFPHHLVGKIRPHIKHRHHHSHQIQPRIDAPLPNLLDDPVNHRDPLQRVILALQRYHQRLHRRESVQGQNAQRRRTIHDHVIEPTGLHNGPYRLPEPQQVVLRPGQLNVRPAKIHLAGNNLQIGKRRRLNLLRQQPLPENRAVCARALDLFQPQPAGRVGLGIEVQQQHPAAQLRQAGGQIHGGGGFAHASLLVGHGNDIGRHGAH